MDAGSDLRVWLGFIRQSHGENLIIVAVKLAPKRNHQGGNFGSLTGIRFFSLRSGKEEDSLKLSALFVLMALLPA